MLFPYFHCRSPWRPFILPYFKFDIICVKTLTCRQTEISGNPLCFFLLLDLARMTGAAVIMHTAAQERMSDVDNVQFE